MDRDEAIMIEDESSIFHHGMGLITPILSAAIRQLKYQGWVPVAWTCTFPETTRFLLTNTPNIKHAPTGAIARALFLRDHAPQTDWDFLPSFNSFTEQG
jgi:hypothetical protein